MTLRLDWCSYEAAKYAVEHWHYSCAMPAGKLARLGVWEESQYVGCVLFGRGAAIHIASPFGLAQTQICELVRVALREHRARVSRILAIALRMIKKAQPGLRLIVSFADSEQGHHGGIYQANGWLYLGGKRDRAYRLHGRMYHPKTLHSRYGFGGQSIPWLRANVDPHAEQVMMADKHKYVYPLDAAMRAQLLPLSKPYPRRQPLESEGPSDQGGIEGAAMRPVGSIEAVSHG